MTRQRWVLFAAVLGSGIVFLDSTVVNVALPRIGRELHSSLFGKLEGQTYVYSGYLLTLSALLILAGALNDFYGRRRMFRLGLIGFGLASVLCGLAPNMEFLIGARVLQGAFGALLVPGSLSLITANYEGEAQGKAFGTWAAGTTLTTILGPVIGGILVDSVSWRAAFLVNVPLIALALYAASRVPESHDEEATADFDWVGAIVIAIGVGGLAFGAIYGQQRQWREPLPFISLAAGAVAVVLFPFLMARRRHPLIPLSLFRSRNFTVTNISTFLIYGALYIAFFNFGLFLQGTIGYTAAAAGLAGLPSTLILVVGSARVGAIAGRFGPRWFMTVGPALMGIALFWLALLPADMAPWKLAIDKPTTYLPPAAYYTDILAPYLLFGAGIAIMVAPLTTALMRSVPVHNSGLASAINNAVSRVGPQLAGAAAFIALTVTFYADLAGKLGGVDLNNPGVRQQVSPFNRPDLALGAAGQAAVRQASADAFHVAMLFCCGLLLVGAVVNGVGIRNEAQPQADVGLRQPPRPDKGARPASRRRGDRAVRRWWPTLTRAAAITSLRLSRRFRAHHVDVVRGGLNDGDVSPGCLDHGDLGVDPAAGRAHARRQPLIRPPRLEVLGEVGFRQMMVSRPRPLGRPRFDGELMPPST